MQANYKNIAVTSEAKQVFVSYTAGAKKTQSECLIAMVQFFLLNNISPFGTEQLANRMSMKIMDDGFKRVEDLFAVVRSFEKNMVSKFEVQDSKINQIGVELTGMKGIQKVAKNMSQTDIENLVQKLHEAEEQVDYLQKQITNLQNGRSVNNNEIINRLYEETEAFVKGEKYKEDHKLIWRHTQMQVSDFLSKFREIAGIKK